MIQATAGKQKELTVFSNDFDTADGRTCIRDYIHVVDLAKAHLQACKRLLQKQNEISFEVFNIAPVRESLFLKL